MCFKRIEHKKGIIAFYLKAEMGMNRFMKDDRRWTVYKNSVTVKSLALIIILSIGILLFMEIISFYYMSIYKKRTIENYQDSLNMYYSYWDNKFNIINNSIILLTSANNADLSYWNVSNSSNELDFQTGKTTLMKKMSEIAWNHENEIILFSYVPERNVFLKSTNYMMDFHQRKQFDGDIQKYIQDLTKYNDTKWSYFKSGEMEFFINVYYLYGGYIGAAVKCEIIMNGMIQDKGVVSNATLLDKEGNSIYNLKAGDIKGGKDAINFMISMNNVDENLQITVLQSKLYSDKMLYIILSVITVFLGLVLLAWNIRFQVKFVLNPLNMLRKAMESFSQGKLDIRLKNNNTSNEIRILYQTFNFMAEQITNLKIQIYESRLKWEKTHSNYLKLQIQPHFYTNILNLIYGLAQIQDYSSIQKLSMTTGTYFRYLMGEKGTFVLLKKEVECVWNYIKIQQMRYEDRLDFKIHVEEKLQDQMVLPLILQTFAENCVKHNITLVPMLLVQINIIGRYGKIYISIEDNGTGFDKEILQKINANENFSENGEHIGIQNVKERLKLFYGDTASVEIESISGRTHVKVILPEVITEEEKNEYYNS